MWAGEHRDLLQEVQSLSTMVDYDRGEQEIFCSHWVLKHLIVDRPLKNPQ